MAKGTENKKKEKKKITHACPKQAFFQGMLSGAEDMFD